MVFRTALYKISMACFLLQMELITQQAMRAGFTGGVLVDYPNSTKAKKYEMLLLSLLRASERTPPPMHRYLFSCVMVLAV